MTEARPRASHDARAAIGLFTRIPVGSLDGRPLRPGVIMAFGPIVGVVLGLAAAAVLGIVQVLVGGPTADGVAAVAALATTAYLTRGLHLDGLADMADGLGANRSPAEAVAVMQRSDIGAFGAATLVFVLLLQTALLAGLTSGGAGLAALLVALPAGRLAAMWLCGPGATAAPGSRLGAWVAGRVSWAVAAAITVVTAAAAGVLTLWTSGSALAGPIAFLAALAAGAAVWAIARRRFAGVTGDVLGTAVEVAQSAALLALAAALL